MRAYLIVLEVSPMTVGATYASLPLHCTLVHWFWLDVSAVDLIKRLQELAKQTGQLKLHSGPEETFTGITKQGAIPVTVNKIKITPELKKLHFDICGALDGLGVKYSAPRYVKQGFTPHVTHQGSEKLSEGESHISTGIYLVEADAPEYGNDRYVRFKIDLT